MKNVKIMTGLVIGAGVLAMIAQSSAPGDVVWGIIIGLALVSAWFGLTK